MNHDTHYNCKLQYDTVRFCTSSDNISLIKGKDKDKNRELERIGARRL